jgi:protease-4
LKEDVRLQWMTSEASPLEAFEALFGVSGTAARAITAAAWVVGDPRAEALLTEMAMSRLPPGSAAVRSPVTAP